MSRMLPAAAYRLGFHTQAKGGAWKIDSKALNSKASAASRSKAPDSKTKNRLPQTNWLSQSRLISARGKNREFPFNSNQAQNAEQQKRDHRQDVTDSII